MTRWFWWLGFISLLACTLPWTLNPGAGLSLNPTDLAEWTSLNPAVRAQSPPLLTTFLLRTPLLVIAVLFGLAGNRGTRWLAALLIFLLAAAQLPPFEFVHDLANVNYQQQTLLAALTLLLGIAALLTVSGQHVLGAGLVISIAGLVAAFFGAYSAVAEMRAFGLDTITGPGMVFYSIALFGAIVLSIIGTRIKKRRTHTPPSGVL